MSSRASRPLRKALAGLVALALLVPASAFAGKPRPVADTASKTLIVYDTSNNWGYLGELFATQSANLVGHFGGYVAHPVSSYSAGEMAAYKAVIYVGSSYGEVLPDAFKNDVLTGSTQVLWMEHNIHEFARAPEFAARYGWQPGPYDTSGVTRVRYKGVDFKRRAEGNGGIATYESFDPTRVTELATAVRPDGTTFPWAVRSANLTYIGEMPFTYMAEQDRYLILADLLFDLLAPQTPERHRALMRLEDVGPDANPARLRAIADYLHSRGVPFSFGVYPVYVDPNGIYNNGVAETIRLREVPEVVSAIKYMIAKGGTMIMHGYTHQYSNLPNPYNGVSGDDFEFYMAHVNDQDFVIYDGPVPGDSQKWALSRVNSSFNEFKASGLPAPTIFEFPHYAASAVDYKAIGTKFTTRYERSLYFGGVLSGGTVDYSRMAGQFFPYDVKDVYGSRVIPENLGNYEPQSYNNHPTRFPAEIVETARMNLAIRDSFASTFFHPYLADEAGMAALREIVEGIQGLGYTFVAPTSI